MEYKLAREVLSVKLQELGGLLFSRWVTEQDPELKKQAEAFDFFGQVLNGEIKEDYQPELDQALEIISALKLLKQSES